MGIEMDQIPRTESLKDTLDRVLSCWQNKIAPDLKRGKLVFISAHGNSLRALVKYLDRISDEGIMKFEIPTGVPLVYEFNEDLQPIDRFYLKSEDDCKKRRLPPSTAVKRDE
jgi:2,3-bisphosphoglycerate-dependent phosphoglycerate mutase